MMGKPAGPLQDKEGWGGVALAGIQATVGLTPAMQAVKSAVAKLLPVSQQRDAHQLD